ncbi:MAG TPA: superoxide dismutase [Microlunatus sp.]
MSTHRTLPSSTRARSGTRSRTRGVTRWAALGVITLGLLVPGAAPAEAGHRDHRAPEVISLPDGFQPEGITIDQRGRDRGTAYFGSRADGDLYAADLRTGKGRVISQGPGTASVGLKTDSEGLLYVSGGAAGNARVVDVRSGDVLATYQLTDNPSFVNDVVLTRDTAWFTDSQQAQLYAVPLARHGRPAPAAAVRTVPLSGDWRQTEGFNANGIALAPDGRSLLVVQSSTGLLFRVDRRTGAATQVDLGGARLTNGDGLLVEGRTLYAVQNRLNQVAVIRLDRSGRSGRLVSTVTDADFDVPTTIAAYGKSLWLPNARFTTPPTPTTTYTAVRIPAPDRG